MGHYACDMRPEWFENEEKPAKKDESRVVVRVRTSIWRDKRGLHQRKDLTFLRRKCFGYNILDEDAVMIGADAVLDRITNLDECPDGLYLVVTCNHLSRDWETGAIEDYDYRLHPLKEI